MSTGHIITIKIAYDLIEIQLQRAEQYRHILFNYSQPSPNLRAIFAEIIRQSAQYHQELYDNIARFDGNAAEHLNKRRGNVYHTWARSKVNITGQDTRAILEACQLELGAVLKAYDEALSIAPNMDASTHELIEIQLYGITSTLDSLEEYQNAL